LGLVFFGYRRAFVNQRLNLAGGRNGRLETFNLTTNNGPILWNEVLRRRWQNGKVVSERYYTAPRHLE
jgi:hypothetical protein